MVVAASRLRGLSRRMLIFQYIQERCSLTREQVQLVCFGDSEYARWKARTELKGLFDAKKLNRGRCMVSTDYIYFRGKMPDNIDHSIQVNWVWTRLQLTGRLNRFDHEVPCGNGLVADAYFVIDGKPYFLELQRSTQQRKFDKVGKYTSYFESGLWDTPDWPIPGKFARILVVTETTKDAERIRKIIVTENVSGLNFKVITLPEVRQGWDTIKWNDGKKEVQAWALPVSSAGK